MPYTFIKWIVWFLLAALVGGVIGYLLRGLRASAAQRRVVAAQPRGLAGDDLDRLRRKANEAAVATADRNAAIAERDELRAERDQLRAQLDECRAAATSGAAGAVHGFAALPTLTDDDLAQGAAVLGRPVKRDDLTLVEGIGPKVAELLHGAGITTWHALADHSVDGLREVLAGGGQRFQMHDPGTWPAQADLVRHGRWDDFKALTDRLDGGREPDA